MSDACPKCGAVYDLLLGHFKDPDLAGFILWNETCYPFDCELAMEQARAAIDRAVRWKPGDPPIIWGEMALQECAEAG